MSFHFRTSFCLIFPMLLSSADHFTKAEELAGNPSQKPNFVVVMEETEGVSDWGIDTQQEWSEATADQTGLEIEEGMAALVEKTGTFRSKIIRFEHKQNAKSIVVKQSPIWQNWKPIDNLGPANLQDAPVFLQMGPDNYWAFGRYGKPGVRNKSGQGKTDEPFIPQPAKLEGFDVPLLTTPWANQFRAPGGLKKDTGGYHAWESRDMVHWVHHGPVTERFSRWVTSAEQVDGKVYLFYDYPNDQDPHVYVDEDLTDGKPGKNLGMAFQDPSDGSDAGFILDKQGRFHVIYEDWSPINASKRSWDSPLAGHAVSDDGPIGYEILAPAVDNRTEPTGEMATYKHPHWLQHPDFKTNIAEYQVHEPEQEAYGDWAAICIGSQYYLFGDFDPIGGHKMAVARFTSSDINEPFHWCGQIGSGHPDPDIGFAEGRFYLWTQQKTDWVSPGPWVKKVEVRVGVDTDNDGDLDQWTDWREVEETYDYAKELSKHVEVSPAKIDLTNLPSGFGFGFEFRVTDTTENESKPMLDRIKLSFEEWGK